MDFLIHGRFFSKGNQRAKKRKYFMSNLPISGHRLRLCESSLSPKTFLNGVRHDCKLYYLRIHIMRTTNELDNDEDYQVVVILPGSTKTTDTRLPVFYRTQIKTLLVFFQRYIRIIMRWWCHLYLHITNKTTIVEMAIVGFAIFFVRLPLHCDGSSVRNMRSSSTPASERRNRQNYWEPPILERTSTVTR